MGQLKPHRSSWDFSENWIKNFIPLINIKIEQIERIHELAARLDENIELEKKRVWNEEKWTKSKETLQPNNRAILGSLKL